MDNAMIYLHIPFCVRKCRYCDFLSFPEKTEETMKAYAQALKKEILSFQGKDLPGISSVFVGGGTPSLLPLEEAEKLAKALKQTFRVADNAEISMEVNPGTVTREKAKTWKAMGINRISMGVQSLNDDLLERLGRIHRRKEIMESYDILRQAGFDNINLDLMSGLPGQTREEWKNTLSEAISMEPEHLSCYSLIIEEGTPFYEEQDQLDLPDEDAERAMYHDGVEMLASKGYARYEISNFARLGRESRHNTGYWRRVPYFGLGLGAASLTKDQVRYSNTRDMKKYLDASLDESTFPDRIREEVQQLSIQDQMEEFMFLGLRCMSGVDSREFYRIFGLSVTDVFGKALDKHTKDGLLIREGDIYRLTDTGVDLSNQVFVDLLMD